MSHSTKFTFVKRGGLLLGSLAVVLTAGTYLQTVVRLDPFARLKETNKDVDPNLGVRIEGATITSYDHGKLVTKASVDRLDLMQDRQRYELFGVKNGMFYGQKGALAFETPKALWNVQAHQLTAPDGARIKNKDIDLDVPMFAYQANSGDVNVPGQVKGKFYTGNVKAIGVKFNINDQTAVTGPIEWEGKVALSFQDGQTTPTKWHIEGDTAQHLKGNIEKFTKGVGEDGEVIIMADVIEHNRTTDVVTATGNVRYFSAKTNMICEKAVIERKVKKATLTGNVQMLLKEKEKQTTISREDGIPPYRPVVPDEIAKSRPQAEGGQTDEQKKLDEEIRSGKNMRSYPTICYAEKIVYYYERGNRRAEITGNPQARQELSTGGWRQVWTNKAFYDGQAETLQLVSADDKFDTRMINSVGDDLVAESITVSTKEGEDEEWSGKKVKGYVMDYGDEFPRDKKVPNKIGGTVPPPGLGSGTNGGGQKPPPVNRTNPVIAGPIGKLKKKG